jgi:RNA recognition motif-containing protein
MKKIFVGNLPFSVTEEQLRSMFQAHGGVDNVSLVTDRDTGQFRGFAFVEMSNANEAEKAIDALNGSDLGGRTLNINEAKPRPERSGGGRRFGGGGGGRGGRGRDDRSRERRW